MLKNKGALALVVDYGSDTSDDDVPGPRVSTKRTHNSEDELSDSERHHNKKDKMLPLPHMFKESSSHDQHIDDPTVHGGRIRTFGHVRGNWASYAYIPCK
ncbi:unnamed protein product [Callosobruchus maculatus]|uniref:U6 snRNA phosphodiesterase 1 n=1 Tax=Callosobruchus maculatus TaxID=64391 RepID=A0A653CYI2_CALMS|nr:unnamed protein product [Callosobruchus maculatus]